MNSNSPWMWLWKSNVKCNKIQILVIAIWTFLFTVPHSVFFSFFQFLQKNVQLQLWIYFFLPPPNLCSNKNMVVNECLCNTITLLQYFFSELSFVIFPVFNYFWKITNLIVVDKHFSKSASSKITAGFFPPSWNRDTCSRIYRYNQLKKDKASHPYLTISMTECCRMYRGFNYTHSIKWFRSTFDLGMHQGNIYDHTLYQNLLI